MITGTALSRLGLKPGLAPLLERGASLFGVTSKAEFGMFLAQAIHESSGFKARVESFNYTPERLLAVFGPRRITVEQAHGLGRITGRAADERSIANVVYGGAWGLRNLGNIGPEDGWRYRGRGYFQLTGLDNYAAIGSVLTKRLGRTVDLVGHPELLEEDEELAVMSAFAYWELRGCARFAAAGDFEGLTKCINGGLIGYDERQAIWNNVKAVMAEDQPATPRPKTHPTAPTPSTAPTQEKSMEPITLSLIAGLAGKIFDMFTPLAREKLTREVARHTDNPEVAAQVANAAIEAVKTATGKADPLEAVMEARANPAVVAQVEASVLEELEKMAPFLDKLAAFEKQSRDDEEASREAAAKRAAAEEYDMTGILIRGAMIFVALLFILLSTVIGVQLYKAGKVDTEVWALFTGLVGSAIGVVTTIYAYRFGSSRGSAAKDVLVQQLSKR